MVAAPMVPWLVYLGQRHIDTVYFLANCSAQYVRDSLVIHDGYNPNIKVYRRSL